DTYHGGQMPRRLAGVEYAAQAARVLAPGGVYAVNVLDMPGLTLSKRQAATLREVFADVCLLATPGMLRGRRDGNVVLAATREAGGVPVGRIQKAARARLNLAMRHGRALDRLLSGTAPVTG
ncbi:MAG: spermidine synthase, partial [Stackebrandtia sp.]